MRVRGLERERKYRKRRYGMKVDGYGVRRVQLALIQRRPVLRGRRVPSPSPAAAGEGMLVFTGTG